MEKMTKSSVAELLSGCSDQELYCLKACAYFLSTITEDLLSKVFDTLDVRALDRKKIIQRLVDKQLFIVDQRPFGYGDAYLLDTHACLQLMIMIAHESSTEEAKYRKIKKTYSLYYSKSEKNIVKERSFILDYLRQNRLASFEYNADMGYEPDVFLSLTYHFQEYEEFKPLLHYLPTEILISLIDGLKKRAENWFIASAWHEAAYLLHATTLSRKQKEAIKSSFGLSQLIYSGNWDQFAKSSQTGFVATALTRAFLEQLRGNYELAVGMYQQCIAIIPKGDFTGEFFYDFAYVCALMQLKTPKSIAKLAALYKKRTKYPDQFDFIPIALLLEIANTPDIDKVAEHLEVEQSHAPLQGLFYEMVLVHYGLAESNQLEHSKVDYLFSFPNLAYLKSLLSLEFPEAAEKAGVTINELSISSLLPPFKKVLPWERTLNLLIHPTEGKAQVEADKSHRIIYLVDSIFGITPKLQTMGKKGMWSKGRKITLSTFYAGMPEMNAFDREIAQSIAVRKDYGYYARNSITYFLSGAEVLKKFIGYPDLYNSSHESVAMEVVLEQPHLTIQKEKSGFVVESNITEPANRDLLSCEMESQSRIKVIEMTAKQKNVLSVLARVSHYPLEAQPKLEQLLQAISADITIHSDLVASDAAITQVDSDSTIVVQLLPVGDEFKVSIYVKPFTQFPPYCVPGKGTKTVMGQGEQASMQAVRNLALEQINLESVQALLNRFDFEEEETLLLPSPAACLEFLDAVRSIESTRIEWPEGVKLKLAGTASASNFTLSMKGKGSWFEMVGELKYNNDQTLSLNELLEQFTANGNQRFIPLGDNEYLALSEQLRKMLRSIQSIASKGKKERLQVSEFVAPLLRSFEVDGLHLETDASYKKLVKKIDKADKMRFELPTLLQASLREYQEEGFRWMAKLNEWGAGACLADDMGLGKTVQTIAMLCHQAPQGAALVVAPASVVSNWRAELTRFAPALKVTMLNEATNRAELISEAADYEVVITTYGLLHTEAEKLAARPWKTIVLDEAHSIKNRETKISKAAMQLKGDFRLMLTGTPIQNHLSEIWNLFQFINPGILGSFEQFTKRFITPIELGADKEKRKELKNIIAPFLLRRTKNEVLDELPGKTEIVIPVELSAAEELFYETLRKKAESNLLASEKNSIQTLAEITRLRQAASHIGLVDSTYKEESVKMSAFFDLVDVMHENNHRALVFSQFTSHLALFKEALDKRGIDYLYLDGSTPILEREKLVKEFQTGNQLLFLISLKAGGLGLNLTAADFIIHLDPWWNPAIEDQASDRAYRIGQTRPVTVYRLIAKNTIEEKILELHRTKKDLADSLLDGTNQSHKLTRDELLELLRRE